MSRMVMKKREAISRRPISPSRNADRLCRSTGYSRGCGDWLFLYLLAATRRRQKNSKGSRSKKIENTARAAATVRQWSQSPATSIPARKGREIMPQAPCSRGTRRRQPGPVGWWARSRTDGEWIRSFSGGFSDGFADGFADGFSDGFSDSSIFAFTPYSLPAPLTIFPLVSPQQ